MIFTVMIAYNYPEEIEYINSLKEMFEATGGTFYYIELETDLETRLERNTTPHRLESNNLKEISSGVQMIY